MAYLETGYYETNYFEGDVSDDTGCGSSESYYVEGYIADDYYESSGAAVISYFEDGYIETDYFEGTGGSTPTISYFEDGYIETGYFEGTGGGAVICYFEEGYIESGYSECESSCEEPQETVTIRMVTQSSMAMTVLQDTQSVHMTTNSDMAITAAAIVKINMETSSSFAINPAIFFEVDMTTSSSMDIVGSTGIPPDLFPWINQMAACCTSLQTKIDQLEAEGKDHLIAEDIEPLFSGREVHYEL